jgi:hypothetical protein
MHLWNCCTMIPFIFLLFFINNSLLFYAFCYLIIIGLLHHSYIHSFIFLMLDYLSIITIFTVLTIIIDFDKNTKDLLFLLEFSIFSIFLFFLLFHIKISEKVLFNLISIVWIPVIFFSLNLLSLHSKIFIFISICFYLWSIFVSDSVCWGFFHIFSMISCWFVLYDLKLLNLSYFE